MNRYQNRLQITPVRKITRAITDIPHLFTATDMIDVLAYKYLGDATLGWLIMIANPDYFHELDIPVGTTIIIPFPLDRALREIGETTN